MPEIRLAGNRFNFFYQDNNSRLIISAHGGNPGDGSKFACPGAGYNRPAVWRTSVHGISTRSQVQDIVNFRNHKGPKDAGGNKWQVSFMGGQQTNWLLSKYARNGGQGYDTYHHYRQTAANENFDVASPTARGRGISVSDVLANVPNQKKQRYTEIWFSFCLSR